MQNDATLSHLHRKRVRSERRRPRRLPVPVDLRGQLPAPRLLVWGGPDLCAVHCGVYLCSWAWSLAVGAWLWGGVAVALRRLHLLSRGVWDFLKALPSCPRPHSLTGLAHQEVLADLLEGLTTPPLVPAGVLDQLQHTPDLLAPHDLHRTPHLTKKVSFMTLTRQITAWSPDCHTPRLHWWRCWCSLDLDAFEV